MISINISELNAITRAEVSRGQREDLERTLCMVLTDEELLKQIVIAWDAYRLGEVALLMAEARRRVGLTLPEKNKDR